MLSVSLWMNMPSFYQDDFIRQLVASEDIDLEVIFARQMGRDRVNLGWQDEPRNYPYRMLSGISTLDALEITRKQRGRLHIVNGIWAEPAFSAALVALSLARTTFVIHAEAPDPFEPRSRVKRLLQNSFGRWVAGRASGILAISSLAADYYSGLGFKNESIYPFAYFKSNGKNSHKFERGSNDIQTEIVFVGQLIRRKGVDILIDSIAPLFVEYSNLRLSLIGDGVETEALREQVRALRITDRVCFEGVLPSDSIESRISRADLLVLPSRWDGWGMVVNEALSVGVPVIASDRCGAADLIQHGVNGYVFSSGDIQDLQACLRSFLNMSDRQTAMRFAAQITGHSVSAEVAAPYLIECLKHMTGESNVRPIPPWLPAPASHVASH